MSLHNDLLEQSRQAKINAQQAGLSGDTRLQDFYNSSADQLFIQGINAKMKADEREAEYQRYYADQEQRKMQAEMQAQHDSLMRVERKLQLERMEFEHECWFNSLSEEQQKLYLEKKQREKEERLEAERLEAEKRQREHEEYLKWKEEFDKSEAERRANMTSFQRLKEDILCSEIFGKLQIAGIVAGILTVSGVIVSVIGL